MVDERALLRVEIHRPDDTLAGVRKARVAVGAIVAVVAIVLIFSPLEVATALHRPHDTAPQMINLRASFGGTLLGLGAFVAWLPSMRPWKRSFLGLLACGMLGIAAARAVGFLVDGHPDTLQWIWLSAEIVIGGACAFGMLKVRSN